MDTVVTREKLHALIDKIPEDRIGEVYEMLEYEEGHYDEEFRAELDAEYADYQANPSGFAKADVDREINLLLYGKK